MAMLSDQDRAMLAARFESSLDRDVTVRLFTQSMARSLLVLPGQQPGGGGELMKVTQDLLQELTSISPKLTLEVYDAYGDGASEAKRLEIEQLPAVVLGNDGEGRVRFYGAPLGNEFPTVLADIESVSQEAPMLRGPVAAAARDLIDEDVHLRVFVTPT